MQCTLAFLFCTDLFLGFPEQVPSNTAAGAGSTKPSVRLRAILCWPEYPLSASQCQAAFSAIDAKATCRSGLELFVGPWPDARRLPERRLDITSIEAWLPSLSSDRREVVMVM